MNHRQILMGAAIAAVAPLFAAGSALASDASYCAQLSRQYETYVASNQDRQAHRVTADIGAAESKCQSDPASAIPTLEKALTDQKVNLPPRN